MRALVLPCALLLATACRPAATPAAAPPVRTDLAGLRALLSIPGDPQVTWQFHATAPGLGPQDYRVDAVLVYTSAQYAALLPSIEKDPIEAPPPAWYPPELLPAASRTAEPRPFALGVFAKSPLLHGDVVVLGTSGMVAVHAFTM